MNSGDKTNVVYLNRVFTFIRYAEIQFSIYRRKLNSPGVSADEIETIKTNTLMLLNETLRLSKLLNNPGL